MGGLPERIPPAVAGLLANAVNQKRKYRLTQRVRQQAGSYGLGSAHPINCPANQRAPSQLARTWTWTAATATAATRATAFIVSTAATASVTTVASPARAPEWPASGHG